MTDVPSEGMNGSLPWITCRRIIKNGLQVMACLSSRARYFRVSTRGRRAVRGDGQNWRLAWVIIFAVLISLRSFFFRQLLAAFLLFTVLFVAVATLIAVFVLIDDGVSSGLGWVESEAYSIHFSMHYSVALPARFSTGGTDCAVRRSKGLDHN
jgi:uncharacterized membrane protein